MEYKLGIDAGGTYTDAVIIDSYGEIVQKNKTKTTYPKLIDGIKHTFDCLNNEFISQLNNITVSTTLSTNTVLEKNGYPVAVILIGDYNISDKSEFDFYTVINGGHDSLGREINSLDVQSADEFILKTKNKVAAFAISSYFSVRNPSHELEIKKRILKLATNVPVVCGYELSEALGASDRANTAYLNAQLLPISFHFIKTLVNEIRRRNIKATISILKCDGSITNIDNAYKKPAELIFSGPAASLIGAAYLANKETCAVIDVGGTSTDVSIIKDKIPFIASNGAKVGNWSTKIESIEVETSAMGGDSHIWIKNGEINIGPKKVIPLCQAAYEYPQLVNELKRKKTILKSQLGENIQPTKFFLRTEVDSSQMSISKHEEEILNKIPYNPISIHEIYWNKDFFPSPIILDKLINKRLIKAIGLTPTDILHVLNEFSEWSYDAAFLGTETLATYKGKEVITFCLDLKKRFAQNMVTNIAEFVFKDVNKSELEKVLYGGFYGNIFFELPIVFIGGSVKAYEKEVSNLLNASIIIPNNAEVGNAVGAAVAKGRKMVNILIKSIQADSRYSVRPTKWVVFSKGERKEFDTYQKALEYGEILGKTIIYEYMSSINVDNSNIFIKTRNNEIFLPNEDVPIESTLSLLGSEDN